MSATRSCLAAVACKVLPIGTIVLLGTLPWFILRHECTLFDIAKGYWRIFVEAHLCVLLLSFVKSGTNSNSFDELGEVIRRLQRRVSSEEQANKALMRELATQKAAQDIAMAGHENELNNERALNATLQQVVKLLGVKVEEGLEAREKVEEAYRRVVERLQCLEEEKKKLVERANARAGMQKILKAALKTHAEFNEDTEIMVLHLDKAVSDVMKELVVPTKTIALNWNGETLLPKFGIHAGHSCSMVISAPQDVTSTPEHDYFPVAIPTTQSPSSTAMNGGTQIVASALTVQAQAPASRRTKKKVGWKPAYWKERGPGWEAKFGPAPLLLAQVGV